MYCKLEQYYFKRAKKKCEIKAMTPRLLIE